MSNKTKRIVILTEEELGKTLSRLTSEIIEKVKNLDNLLLVGIPTRGIYLAEVLEKELFLKTGLKIKRGIIDPTFYRDDQNRVGTRLMMLLVMVDRGHRELPIQPDFCGKKVPTSKNESINLRLRNIDNEEGVFLD